MISHDQYPIVDAVHEGNRIHIYTTKGCTHTEYADSTVELVGFNEDYYVIFDGHRLIVNTAEGWHHASIHVMGGSQPVSVTNRGITILDRGHYVTYDMEGNTVNVQKK